LIPTTLFSREARNSTDEKSFIQNESTSGASSRRILCSRHKYIFFADLDDTGIVG